MEDEYELTLPEYLLSENIILDQESTHSAYSKMPWFLSQF